MKIHGIQYKSGAIKCMKMMELLDDNIPFQNALIKDKMMEVPSKDISIPKYIKRISYITVQV